MPYGAQKIRESLEMVPMGSVPCSLHGIALSVGDGGMLVVRLLISLRY